MRVEELDAGFGPNQGPGNLVRREHLGAVLEKQWAGKDLLVAQIEIGISGQKPDGVRNGFAVVSDELEIDKEALAVLPLGRLPTDRENR